MAKTTYRQQTELVADIQMNDSTAKGVKKLRRWLVDNGYEDASFLSSDEAIKSLREQLS
jgi:hypothetical protein